MSEGFKRGIRKLGDLVQVNAADGSIIITTTGTGMTNPMLATGDVIYGGVGGTPQRRAIGTAGQVLTVSGGNPVWADLPADTDNYIPLPATPSEGDLLYYHSGAWARLPKGTNGDVLTMVTGDPAWAADAGGGGGGSGAATTDHFFTSQFESDLSAEIAIPGLAVPDRAVGGGSDDEFDAVNASAWTGWTQWTATGGAPTAADESTTALSHAYLRSNSTGSDVFAGFGILAASDPSVTPYTVTAKCSDHNQYQTASFICLVVSDTIDGSGKMVAFGVWGGRFRGTYSANNTYSTNLDTGDYIYRPPFYIRFVVHSPTNIDVMYSADGITWKTQTAALNYLANAKYVGIAQDHFVQVESAWDFVRFS